MRKKIAILGSTGSIGKSLLNIVKTDSKSFEVVLLSAHKNYKELLKQSKTFNVRNLIVTDKKTYEYLTANSKYKKYQFFNNFYSFKKILKKKIDYTLSAIVGLDGLIPTIKIIKYSKTIAIANKETIICGWNLIQNELKKYNTKFIPVDSEHFSVWSTLSSKTSNIEKIYLTASGGPFYKKKFEDLKNIKISQALKHPTWKMGRKISIDSATLINKIFEIIEAKKIFNISYKKLSILIHPKSYVHAVLKYDNGIINIIAHETTMAIPLSNSLYWGTKNKIKTSKINLENLNSLNFSFVNKTNFPLISIINKLPKKDSLFETVLVSANDYLVNLFLDKKITYTDICNLLIKITNMKKFNKYKKITPFSISDILKINHFTINEIKKLIKNVS